MPRETDRAKINNFSGPCIKITIDNKKQVKPPKLKV